MDAFTSKADILIYGGAAGAGKSFFLVTEPLRHAKVKGFTGAIFRRTYPQIKGQGGIWDEACGLYPHAHAKMREGQELDARFPSGAKISFNHLQHEKTKYEYQGHQICYLGFDELTHFTQTQFFYLLSRNRSTCGVKPYVRATCNPDAGSWVAEFIDWWIDDDGFPDRERAGKLRYFVRGAGGESEEFYWADTKEEILERFPGFEPDDVLSVTFVPGDIDDNPTLLAKDPTYKARLKALSRVERARLLGGNWKITEGAIIEREWLNEYTVDQSRFHFLHHGLLFEVPIGACQRIATIDTAGTSRDKAEEERGEPPSWSVCAIWDSLPIYQCLIDGSKYTLTEMLFLRYVWRDRVNWNGLKTSIPKVLQDWNVQRTFIENAHHGAPLAHELKGFQTELIGPMIPGMGETGRGAKLERAVASGMLTRVELGKVLIPQAELQSQWLKEWIKEHTVWTGLPKETADQIDTTSYASYKCQTATTQWGGVVKTGPGVPRRR